MNNFLYSINKSFDEMKTTVDKILSKPTYADKDRQELFYSIATCLHFMLDCAERLEIQEDSKEFISAFRYINNNLKHNNELEEISTHKGGLTFPMSFPLIIPIRKIVWRVDDNWTNKGQMENYKKLLDNKNVVTTLQELKTVLLNCTKKL